MKYHMILALAILPALIGCAPSEQAIQTSIALTQVNLQHSPQATNTQPPPAPIFTATPIPSTATPTPNPFFTEEFNQALSADWSLVSLGPFGYDVGNVESDVQDGHLVVTINGRHFYAYTFFERFTYRNVRLDMRAENQGVNTNTITLMCRKTETGWLEFNVTSGGAWGLEAFFFEGPNKGYNLLASGGTLELKQGREVNEFTLICSENLVSMLINGVELRGSPYNLGTVGAIHIPFDEGQVGFNISSFNVTPVIVKIDWFKVSEP
jgi:hypothetical protein